MSATNADVTALLQRWGSGDAEAFEELLPIVYAEMRSLAAGYLRREGAEGTLQPTALVNEVYLRLADQRRNDFQNRAHFYGGVAKIIRRILVDRARGKHTVRHGGESERVAFEDIFPVGAPPNVEMIALDAALSDLEQFDPQKAKVVELRYFAGLTIPETAEAMNLSPTSVKREWSIARAWLFERLSGVAAPQD